MSKTIEDVLSAPNLIGVIQNTKTGLLDVLPPGLNTPGKVILGDQGTYTRVDGVRKTARLAQYGAPSRRRNLTGVSEIPVRLIHTAEHIVHNPIVLQNLLSVEGSRQQLGRMEIARQTRDFRILFDNLRLAAIYSALSLGAVYFDGDGNLLASSSGAVVTVDFGVPAGNQDQLDVDGDGSIIDASWATAGTDIVGQIMDLKKRMAKLNGYVPEIAMYGASVLEHLLSNTAIASLISGSSGMSEQAAAGAVPRGLLGLDWYPVASAFFEDNDGTAQSLFGDDTVVFAPRPSPDWWEVLQGTYVVPTTLGNVSADGSGAVSDLTQVNGMFSYAHVSSDPPSIKHVAGDTFLPVLKVPAAICIADVTP